MADEPKWAEQIPSISGANSAIASASAPVIFIDEFPTSGFYGGIAHITCETIRFHPAQDGSVQLDRMTVAHLRMNFSALVALKAAIARIEGLLEKAGESLPPPKRAE